MSQPNWDHSPSPELAGDKFDDDGMVIDSLVESDAEPPQPKEMPMERDTIAPKKAPEVNRLATGTSLIDNAWSQPTLLIPSDPFRKSVLIWATGDGSFVYAGLRDNCRPDFAAVVPAGTSFFVEDYNGPVWVMADPANVEAIRVNFHVVTK